ncbi:MAG: MopE-related protein [Myxococcota bacterium]
MNRRDSLLLLCCGGALALVVASCGDPGGGGGGTFPTDTSTSDSGFNTCEPSCHFKSCGDDGCGGSCGTCGAGSVCESFQCVTDDGGVVDPVDASRGGGPDASTEPSGPDEDGDGIADAHDVCPTLFDPEQKDQDGDHVGDLCDPDRDGDGSLNELDCDPDDPLVHPDAPERCNGVDDDCDGETDEEDADGCTDYYLDADGDGAGTAQTRRCLCGPDTESGHLVTVGGDCDDEDASRGPLVPEKCDDVDNNCNLLVDEGCDDDGDGWCDADMEVVGTPDVCPHGGGDCYDYSPLVNPAASEVEGNGVDDDCDGEAAGEPDGQILQPNCSGPCTGETLGAALCAMEICYPGLVLSQNITGPYGDIVDGAWKAISHYGSPTNDLAPFAGDSYLVMGTGYPDSSHQDELPLDWLSGDDGVGSDPFSDDGFTTHDAVELTVKMKAPEGAKGFSIDYIFMSAEYEEFIGSDFNDKFYVILDAPQTTNGKPRVVNFTDCSDPSSYYDYEDPDTGDKQCYIAINTAFSEPCSNPTTDISGTGHECDAGNPDGDGGGSSTGWLTTTWPIEEGEVFTLTFHIHDTSDWRYDSTVLLDNFQWKGGVVEGGTASHN